MDEPIIKKWRKLRVYPDENGLYDIDETENYRRWRHSLPDTTQWRSWILKKNWQKGIVSELLKDTPPTWEVNQIEPINRWIELLDEI